jgi:hypothetical protein
MEHARHRLDLAIRPLGQEPRWLFVRLSTDAELFCRWVRAELHHCKWTPTFSIWLHV